jgi:hypothetical protein
MDGDERGVAVRRGDPAGRERVGAADRLVGDGGVRRARLRDSDLDAGSAAEDPGGCRPRIDVAVRSGQSDQVEACRVGVQQLLRRLLTKAAGADGRTSHDADPCEVVAEDLDN